jgi:Tfp pilus assembly PilM family ATPase
MAGDARHTIRQQEEVIVLAADRVSIDARLAMLADLGLNPVAIDAEPCATFRSFERLLQRQEDRERVNTFMDLGYEGTRTMVTCGRSILALNSTPVGGRIFDQLVSERLGLSLRQTGDLRLRLHRQMYGAEMGDSPGQPHHHVSETTRWAVLDAFRPALDQVAEGIVACRRYASETFDIPPSETIIATGGEAYNRDLIQRLSDQVGTRLEIGRTIENIALEEDVENRDRRTGQPDWANVLGLAFKPVCAPIEVAS